MDAPANYKKSAILFLCIVEFSLLELGGYVYGIKLFYFLFFVLAATSPDQIFFQFQLR